MALTFEQLNDTATNPVVRGRIRVAATRVAMDTADEPTAGAGSDARWQARQKLARSVIDQAAGDALLDRLVWATIGVVNVTGAAPTDAELEQYLTDAWDRIAGVTAADQ